MNKNYMNEHDQKMIVALTLCFLSVCIAIILLYSAK